MWLLRGLGEAGSSKKKTSAVRFELLSLDVPLASVLHCLFAVCRLAPPAHSSGGRPAVRHDGGSGREEASGVLNLGASAAQDRAGEALPSKRAAYDAAVDLLLEYAGELISLSSGSTSTLFDRLDSLARDAVTPNQDNVQIRGRPAPSGGRTLSASVRRQVDCMRVCARIRGCFGTCMCAGRRIYTYQRVSVWYTYTTFIHVYECGAVHAYAPDRYACWC